MYNLAFVGSFGVEEDAPKTLEVFVEKPFLVLRAEARPAKEFVLGYGKGFRRIHSGGGFGGRAWWDCANVIKS